MNPTRLHRSFFRPFGRDASGTTALEFAFIGPPLVLMLCGVVELGLMQGAQAVLDNSVFAASRVGKTGFKEAGKTQDDAVSAAIKTAASKYLDPAKIQVTSKAYADYSDIGQPEPFTDANKNGKRDAGESYTDTNGNGSYDVDRGKGGLGASTQIVVYTATYNWPISTPLIGKLIGKDGVRSLKSEIAVRNEPY
jgi:Flp pilus assembly protein TadG